MTQWHAADPDQMGDHVSGIARRLKLRVGRRNQHRRGMFQVSIGITLYTDSPCATQAFTPACKFDPATVHALVAAEIVQQRAIPATSRTRLPSSIISAMISNPDVKVWKWVFGAQSRCSKSSFRSQAAVFSGPSKTRTRWRNSGSSAKCIMTLWYLSRKTTLAATAFRARTTSRLSSVEKASRY